MAKVELYFAAPHGGEPEWSRFLARVVTPRFPSGLTSLRGAGQWSDRHGLAREPSRILVIFYKPDATSDTRIEAIRALYKRRYGQASVLRADSIACVGF